MNNISTLNIIQVVIIISLFIVIILLIRQNISIKFERRIGRYSIEPIKSKSNSLFNTMKRKYKELILKLRPILDKTILLKKLSKKYEKYISYGDSRKAIDFITTKIIISLIFLLLTIFSQVLQFRVVSLIEIFINLIIGFYILDIYLIFDKKKRKKQIENQMLRAIIIMNNAFKSGKSTLQAVEIASKELSEPLNHEFEKMYKDMKYGLSVDTVFERFAKRIDIEEARYISSSLTVLNKTGGNIVRVFSSIERTLFDKKKLREELKNLTASSNLIVKILLAVPFVFVSIIYFLNPSYFSPFFDSPIGYILLLLIFLMFIAYTWFLQKLMKVRG